MFDIDSPQLSITMERAVPSCSTLRELAVRSFSGIFSTRKTKVPPPFPAQHWLTDPLHATAVVGGAHSRGKHLGEEVQKKSTVFVESWQHHINRRSNVATASLPPLPDWLFARDTRHLRCNFLLHCMSHCNSRNRRRIRRSVSPLNARVGCTNGACKIVRKYALRMIFRP